MGSSLFCRWLAFLLIVFVPLEKARVLHPRRLFRTSFGTDLVYYFLGGLAPKLLLVRPLTLLALHHLVGASFNHTLAPYGLLSMPSAALVPRKPLPLGLSRHSSQRGRGGLVRQFARPSPRYGLRPHLRVRAHLHARFGRSTRPSSRNHRREHAGLFHPFECMLARQPHQQQPRTEQEELRCHAPLGGPL